MSSFLSPFAKFDPKSPNSAVAQQFATTVQGFQSNSGSADANAFQVVEQFKGIAASFALSYGDYELNFTAKQPAPEYVSENLQNFDLETKLWHLFIILYGFRIQDGEGQLLPENEHSSDAVREHNYLIKHTKIKEISLIIHWLQENSKTTEVPSDFSSKWKKTQSMLQNKEYYNLSSAAPLQSNDSVRYLDSDAPIRESLLLEQDDISEDTANFRTIYKLVLDNRIEEAIEFSNNTGNFTLSLILLGAVHDYLDPIVDENNLNLEVEDITTSEPSGQRHKSLWRKTVYKLSQQTGINSYEKLIYSYLCGGEVSMNLKEASNSWEDQLLIYLNQLFKHSISEVYANENEDSSSIPLPQSDSIDSILNILSETTDADHPLRIMSGGIMINQLHKVLHSTIKNLLADDEGVDDYIIRVVTHLSIFLYNIDQSVDSISSKDLTKIISLYTRYLSKNKLEEFIPIYLQFIPNEKDARECYSLFLSSLTDDEKRRKQLDMAKRFVTDDIPSNSDSDEMDIDEGKMVNVLRRTVERVMIETAPHYTSSGGSIVVEIDEVDDIDYKLYRSVEWFYENRMYEDAITATIVVFRRFLLSGKLASLKKFSEGKSFKQLIKNYDVEINTKLLSSSVAKPKVNEEMKEELSQYDLFIQGLTLLDEQKRFWELNKFNGVNSDDKSTFWKSNHLQMSVEKITSNLNKLIFNWFKVLIKSENVSGVDVKLFKEYRSIYAPFLTIELLQIYQFARLNDWKYMRSAFELINLVANDEENDLLSCFVSSGRLNEFVKRSGELAAIASERGIKGIFY
ncbi:nucleoporin Nup84p [[Candida] railenensis]|uniref:Nuclear pore complex protein n=1 Tax=[Candida] railenensis TaxID=45579 RepID=A0A9P0VZF3_9ASCO|nr:nucleoporin Nup84p [[Candida] railenensis]